MSRGGTVSRGGFVPSFKCSITIGSRSHPNRSENWATVPRMGESFFFNSSKATGLAPQEVMITSSTRPGCLYGSQHAHGILVDMAPHHDFSIRMGSQKVCCPLSCDLWIAFCTDFEHLCLRQGFQHRVFTAFCPLDKVHSAFRMPGHKQNRFFIWPALPGFFYKQFTT